jgi:hypothetical protein
LIDATAVRAINTLCNSLWHCRRGHHGHLQQHLWELVPAHYDYGGMRMRVGLHFIRERASFKCPMACSWEPARASPKRGMLT